MRRVLYVAGVLLLVAVASTSQAYAAPAWHGEAGVPSNVDLSSVAALPVGGDDVVVAVGQDTSKQAVIYRRVGGVWQQDPIYDSLNGIAPNSCLVSVSVTPQAAWAVGAQGGTWCDDRNTTGAQPLVVVFPAGGAALATRGATAGSNAWHFVTPAGPAPLDSVSLAGKSGYIASVGGTAYAVEDADKTPAPGWSPSAVTPPPSGATTTPFVAAFDPGDGSPAGFGVSGSSNASDAHVLQLTGGGSSTAAAAAAVPLAGVAAALTGTQAIAIASGDCGANPTQPCYWTGGQGGAWAADPGTNFGHASGLTAVSIAGSGGSIVEAVAGATPDGAPAVWSRLGTSQTGWNVSTNVGTKPLTGVAALAQYDIWAVGNSGTVEHYVYDHDPVPPPTGGTSTPPTTTSTSGSTPPPSKTAPAPGPPPHVTVVQPPPKRTRGHKGHHPKVTRLVSHVHVKVDVGRLIVTFRLSARAKIQLQGRTGGRLVAAAGPRTMRKGRARMVLRYKGAKPPAQLRIIAHPARKK